MMALSFLYALCIWISLVCPSLGTGFVYHFPGITVQRQRIKSEQSGSTAGPPGTRSSTQLRWVFYIYILFSRRFYPKRLTIKSSKSICALEMLRKCTTKWEFCILSSKMCCMVSVSVKMLQYYLKVCSLLFFSHIMSLCMIISIAVLLTWFLSYGVIKYNISHCVF